MSFLHIITLIGVSQGVFLAVFLLLKRSKALINLPLAIYILLMSGSLLNTLFIGEGSTFSLFGFAYITELCNLAYGLLIFIYTRNKIEGHMALKKTDFWFATPFALYFIYYLLFYKDVYYASADYLSAGLEFSGHILEWSFEIAVNVGFLIASLYSLRTYHRQIEQNYSDLERINFNSTRNLVYVCLAAYLFEVILVLLLAAGVDGAKFYYNLIYVLFIGTLFLFGYNELIYSTSTATTVVKAEKYKKSTLKSDSSKLIAEDLRTYMREHQPYLNPELTLKSLAESVNLQPHGLSQVINENFGQNFYEFINSYRIEEAKRLLKEPKYKDYTLTAIGFEAGFNSKSVFYTAFKKNTGMSPAKFMVS